MVDQLKAKYKVDLEWRPYYLHPDTPPGGMDLPDYIRRARANGSDERLQGMADMHGMPFKSPDRIYNTRIAHEATEYARGHGKAIEFHHVVFRQVYAEGLDVSKWEVLRAAAVEVRLDADDMQAVVDSGKYTAEVARQVQYAQQIGVTGVPTYVINDRYAVVGAQPYEAFQRALAQIAKNSQS
ncbi:MAG: DsbA family oxidoreductase [Chloroflexi bacterium]|nr:DsbA family oxidoreductase [Chloroflexota bacterium]